MPTTSTGSRAISPSGIREMFERANGIPDVVHLEIGEPGCPPPDHVRSALIEAVERGISSYTSTAGLPELREAVAWKVRTRNRLPAEERHVVVTPGAIAGVFAALRVLCDPGDRILVPDPGWPNYRTIAGIQGLDLGTYPVHPGGPRPEDVESAFSAGAKALILNSPGNPTGTVIDPRKLQEILALAERQDAWVVSDEVYDALSFDRPSPSAAALGDPQRVVTAFSFSKTYAMTGWRLGYVVAPEEIARSIAQIHQATATCASAPVQWAGLAALTGPQEFVDDLRSAFRHRRERVLSRLQDGCVSATRPSGAFYVWVDISRSGLTGTEFAARLLERKKVAVTPGLAFGPAGTDFVRVSLGASQEELDVGVAGVVDLVHEPG